ncbi:c-type cytochrome domain-containing protein [Planctomicrobium sp. SH661]|uniref:c-type cytochrome domain-containing protein n=1 Tax=Planctomicrobium sp. SH661 TaxID=3448124 RepID=UPI003F5BBE60
MLRQFCIVSALIFLAGLAYAEDAKAVNYEADVRPILRQYCFKCHGEGKQEAGINLSEFGSLINGGSAGKIVVAGRASNSLLFEAITQTDPEARMPPNSPPLPDDKIEIIRLWIQNGLLEKAGSASMSKARDLTFTPAPGSAGKPDGPPPMPGKLPRFPVPKTARPMPVLTMAASPWAPLLAVSGQEQIRLVNLETRKPMGALSFPEGEPHVLRFSADGRVLMAAGGRPVQNGVAVLYDVQSGKRLVDLGDEIDEILASDLSPDQQQLALGGSNKAVKVYSTTDKSLLYKLDKHTDWITSIAFSPDGTKLATGDRVGGIHLWDAKSGGILLSLSEHKGSVNSLAWRSDGRMLASGGEDGLIVWWDPVDGWPAASKPNAHNPPRPAGVFGKLPNGVLSVAFLADGNLVSCGRDRQARLWSADGGNLRQMDVPKSLPTQVAVAADGQTMIIGDSTGQLHYWDVKK